jgi:hypothetical protein
MGQDWILGSVSSGAASATSPVRLVCSAVQSRASFLLQRNCNHVGRVHPEAPARRPGWRPRCTWEQDANSAFRSGVTGLAPLITAVATELQCAAQAVVKRASAWSRPNSQRRVGHRSRTRFDLQLLLIMGAIFIGGVQHFPYADGTQTGHRSAHPIHKLLKSLALPRGLEPLFSP